VSGTDARQWSFDALRKVPGGWSDSARGAEGIDAYYARWCERAAAKRRSNPSAVLSRNATPSVFHQRHIGRVLRLRAFSPDEDLYRHAVENLVQADALLFGRVTYEMGKYVVSSTLDRVDWNAELVRGDLGKAVQQLKREPGKGLFVGGVKLPLALAELESIDEYEFVVQPRLAGQGPTLFAGYRSIST
jgi:hypothetical protein